MFDRPSTRELADSLATGIPVRRMYESLTDDQLLEAANRALALAHDAPKCLAGPEAAPVISGDAWARHSREWMDMQAEIDRRIAARRG